MGPGSKVPGQDAAVGGWAAAWSVLHAQEGLAKRGSRLVLLLLARFVQWQLLPPAGLHFSPIESCNVPCRLMTPYRMFSRASAMLRPLAKNGLTKPLSFHALVTTTCMFCLRGVCVRACADV